MEDNDLRKLLEQVHDEIEKSDTLDDKARGLLSHLDADIRALLDKSNGQVQEPEPSVIHRLEESIDYLEVTHPTLTMVLSQVLGTLSNAGV
jgi:hypothetical protein